MSKTCLLAANGTNCRTVTVVPFAVAGNGRKMRNFGTFHLQNRSDAKRGA